MAAIQPTVGKEAGDRLGVQHNEKTGQYLVEIKGDVNSFRDINEVASTFAIITVTETGKFSIVGSKERMDMGDGKEYTLSANKAAGATARDR